MASYLRATGIEIEKRRLIDLYAEDELPEAAYVDGNVVLDRSFTGWGSSEPRCYLFCTTPTSLARASGTSATERRPGLRDATTSRASGPAILKLGPARFYSIFSV